MCILRHVFCCFQCQHILLMSLSSFRYVRLINALSPGGLRYYGTNMRDQYVR